MSNKKGKQLNNIIMEVYRLADTCNYGNLRDEMIRDRLVVGIRDTTLSAQLQFDAELTLEKAKTKIRQREAVGQQQAELKSGPRRQQNTPVEAVHPGKTYGRRMQREPQIQQRAQQREAKPCKRCRRSSHPRDKCPPKMPCVTAAIRKDTSEASVSASRWQQLNLLLLPHNLPPQRTLST